MQLSKLAKHLLHTALVLLVLAGVAGIHSHHLDLDGHGPAVSVHFENFSVHPDHATDVAHEDAHEDAHAEVENKLLPQVLPGKTPDQDSPLFLTAVLFLFRLRLPQHALYRDRGEQSLVYRPPRNLLPPLRAPPVHSR